MKIPMILLLCLGGLVLSYPFLFNYVVLNEGNLLTNQTNDSYYTAEGFLVKVGTGDSISVQITRPRWYGTIRDKGNSAVLSIFNFIPLQLKKDGKSFINFHIGFVIGTFITLVILILTMILPKSNKKEIDERGYTEEEWYYLTQ